jgi:hypothetical protein
MYDEKQEASGARAVAVVLPRPAYVLRSACLRAGNGMIPAMHAL